MLYAKLTNGRIEYSPVLIYIDGQMVCNPSPEILVSLGYKPLIPEEMPDIPDGYHAEAWFIDEGDHILGSWTLAENPPEPVNPIANVYDDTKRYVTGDCVQYFDGLYQLQTIRAKGIDPTNPRYWKNLSLSEYLTSQLKKMEQELQNTSN